MILVCVDCEKATALIEANARRFNTGRCGHCGGELVPQLPVERPKLAASDETEKK